MKVYRGTQNLYPEELNHRKISSGYYGEGTYFALTTEVAERYSRGSKIRVITHYEIEVGNCLKISNDEIENLEHFLPDEELKLSKTIRKKLKFSGKCIGKDLLKHAEKAGFNSIILTGQVEGGDQLIVPATSSILPTVTGYTLGFWIFYEKIQENFINYMNTVWGLSVVNSGGWLTFVVTVKDFDRLPDLINFYRKVSCPSTVDADFFTKKIEEDPES